MLKPKLKVTLASRNMKQMDLVRATGIRQPTISAICLNHKLTMIRIDTIHKICKALNCQPNDIFEYVPDEKTPSE